MVATPLSVVVSEKVPQIGAQDAPAWTGAQVTPLPAGSKETVALKSCAAFTGISADVGSTDTLMAGTVICTEFDFDVSVADVAVSVALRLLAGASAGALYVTDVLVVLLSVPTPVAGDKLQVTPALLGS